MENVTEGKNSADKTDDSTPDEAACSNGEKGSEGGEKDTAEAEAVKVTPSTPGSSSFRRRVKPPKITFHSEPVAPPGSDSPTSSDVSSSKNIWTERMDNSWKSSGGGFGASFGSNRAFKLNPSRLSNTFAKADGDKESVNSSESVENEDKTTSASSSKSTVAFVPLGAASSSGSGAGPGGGVPSLGSNISSNVTSTEAADSTSTPLSPSTAVNSTTAAASTVVSSSPITTSATSTNNSTTTTSTGSSSTSSSFSFVFGQNIRDKVDVVVAADVAAADANEPSSTTPDTKEVTANGTSTSEMLFSAQVRNTDKTNDSGGKTLSEAAREYEEARNVKRKFDEVQVLTGEEEEANVLQINCKFFAWNNNSWTERGRGTLRVNDFPNIPSQHRLIARTAGSLRVVLNTKIWSGMTVDRASAKSMRITAMDSSGLLKVFLVMAGSKEMDQLQKCLDWRVNNLKKLCDPTAMKKTKADDDVTDKS